MKLGYLVSFAALASVVACTEKFEEPAMGDYVTYEIDIKELSGLCFNADMSALLACGDKGVVKSISFDGKEIEDVWEYSSDMEGITVHPSSGDIYLAIEGRQEIHRLVAPAYSSQIVAFPIQEAIDNNYGNDGLEAVEFYKNNTLFVGSQRNANLWQYKTNGKLVSKVSLSGFAKEIAGLCYDQESGSLWVTDSKQAMIFVCKPDGTLLASYDISWVDNAESICIDRARSCVWVASDEDATKLYKIDFKF